MATRTYLAPRRRNAHYRGRLGCALPCLRSRKARSYAEDGLLDNEDQLASAAQHDMIDLTNMEDMPADQLQELQNTRAKWIRPQAGIEPDSQMPMQ
jgi:hypothetical protein